MKPTQLLLAGLMLFISSSLFAQTTKKETIKVWGNCGTCKKHIEKAAISAGASHADWNKSTKMLQVSYDPEKVSDEAIQKSIAAAGYDTEKFRGDDKAYHALDECCQYDRMKSSTSKQ